MPKRIAKKKKSGEVRLRVRVVVGADIVVGPGKADLLEGIQETGSIAAAGRSMGMSYKRAWYLIDSMNKCFRASVVEAVKGGKVGGGAHLTPTGVEVLRLYRQIELHCRKHAKSNLSALLKMTR